MKITTWNVENLFILMDKYSGENLKKISNNDWENLSISTTVKNKNIEKIEEIANIIKEIDSDVYILQEIGGKESLFNLNKYFLNSEYSVFCDDGNSSRGITTGFLVNKRILKDFKIEFVSNKKKRMENGEKLLRDFPCLNFIKKNKVIFSIVGVHLKSQRGSDNDFKGIKTRHQEFNFLSNMILNNKDIPIIFGGDFNIDFSSDEKNKFYEEVIDFNDLKLATLEERCTQVFFSNFKVLNQLDYLLISKNHSSLIDKEKSFTYRFRNEYGDLLGFPDTIFEKKLLPSDHYPVILKIRIN